MGKRLAIPSALYSVRECRYQHYLHGEVGKSVWPKRSFCRRADLFAEHLPVDSGVWRLYISWTATMLSVKSDRAPEKSGALFFGAKKWFLLSFRPYITYINRKISGGSKMIRKLTTLKAIRLKCIDCCAGNKNEVKLCTCTQCPLYE